MRIIKHIFILMLIVITSSTTVHAEELYWEYEGYSYDLIKRVQYGEIYNRVSVYMVTEENENNLSVGVSYFEGELADFEVCIRDEDYNMFFIKQVDTLGTTVEFSEIAEAIPEPGQYIFGVTAKGYTDTAIDEYDLYVSYNGEYIEPDTSYTDEITSNDSPEITTQNDSKPDDDIKVTDSAVTETKKTDVSNSSVSTQTTTTKTQEAITKATESTVNISDETTTIIKPNKVALKSVKRLKNKKKAKITWGKLKNENIMYEIKYSTSKKFAKKKTKTVTSKKNSIILSRLSKNKKYYIKVRGYILVNGEKNYGPYSKFKTLTKAK